MLGNRTYPSSVVSSCGSCKNTCFHQYSFLMEEIKKSMKAKNIISTVHAIVVTFSIGSKWYRDCVEFYVLVIRQCALLCKIWLQSRPSSHSFVIISPYSMYMEISWMSNDIPCYQKRLRWFAQELGSKVFRCCSPWKAFFTGPVCCHVDRSFRIWWCAVAIRSLCVTLYWK